VIVKLVELTDKPVTGGTATEQDSATAEPEVRPARTDVVELLPTTTEALGGLQARE
jgi:hypothetical protein